MKRLSLQRLGLPAVLLLFCCVALPAQENSGDHHYTWSPGKYSYSEHRDPCKVFIGVGTSSVPGGLKVDYTVDDTPASISGIQAGDVILSLDGVAVSTHSELVNERNKHQQGEAFVLRILRDGSEMDVNARFKSCSKEEQEQYQEREEEMQMAIESAMERMQDGMFERGTQLAMLSNMEKKERPILGVYEDDEISKPGLVVGSVIPGKGAAAAGLQEGDIVTMVDGKTVTGGGTLRAALTGHQPGDRVVVAYQRAGQTLQVEVTLSADRSYSVFKTERDPCAVFIGVYTESGMEGRGVRVTGIVDETPAKQSGVQPGDIILALDGQPVNTTGTLIYERDKHKPGDAFRLTVDRDGAILTIDATFKPCPKPGAPAKETLEVLTQDKKAEQRTEGPVNVETLTLESLELYPNPTTGPLNVRFEAEAVPTTVRIFDTAGKAVYSKVLNQFNGYFSEQINLFGNTPGTYILSVQQGKKVSSKKVMLVPGA